MSDYEERIRLLKASIVKPTTTTMASKLKIFAPRQDCVSPALYYVCSSNGFEGCCSVDPCALPGCPDNASSTTDDSSTTAAATSSTLEATIEPAATTVEASSTVDSEPTTVASTTEVIEPTTTTSSLEDGESTGAIETTGPTSTPSPSEVTSTADTLSDYNYTPTGSGSIETTAITSQGKILTTTISRQADSTNPSSSSPTSATSSTSNHGTTSVPIGAVVGGVLGALVLGALLAYLVILLRRRKRNDQDYTPRASQARHRSSMGSLGRVFGLDAKHASSPDPSANTPTTPLKKGFWKRDSEGPVSAQASPVPQLDGFPVSTGRYEGGLAELQDTSRPVELPADEMPRRRGQGG